VLVFLRHSGCAFCREQVAQLQRDEARFARLGVTIGLITVGKPEDTARFCADRDLHPPFVCLSDHERAGYHAYGLSRGRPHELLAPRVFARGFQAALHGHFQGLPKGDPFQMPGIFIVDTTGTVRYAHRSADAADNPSNAEIFAVLDRIHTPLTP
jgi:peroxiredoxin